MAFPVYRGRYTHMSKLHYKLILRPPANKCSPKETVIIVFLLTPEAKTENGSLGLTANLCV